MAMSGPLHVSGDNDIYLKNVTSILTKSLSVRCHSEIQLFFLYPTYLLVEISQVLCLHWKVPKYISISVCITVRALGHQSPKKLVHPVLQTSMNGLLIIWSSSWIAYRGRTLSRGAHLSVALGSAGHLRHLLCDEDKRWTEYWFRNLG